MSTFGLVVMVAGALLIYWAFGGGKLDITTGQPATTPKQGYTA